MYLFTSIGNACFQKCVHFCSCTLFRILSLSYSLCFGLAVRLLHKIIVSACMCKGISCQISLKIILEQVCTVKQLQPEAFVQSWNASYVLKPSLPLHGGDTEVNILQHHTVAQTLKLHFFCLSIYNVIGMQHRRFCTCETFPSSFKCQSLWQQLTFGLILCCTIFFTKVLSKTHNHTWPGPGTLMDILLPFSYFHSISLRPSADVSPCWKAFNLAWINWLTGPNDFSGWSFRFCKRVLTGIMCAVEIWPSCASREMNFVWE